ncbi:hypothetical protein AX17_004675 [Amanita inopinata Kibby_2008]|nr:hypothetical protein AX17_004675 [Amanita inopinata Kibby_2008]
MPYHALPAVFSLFDTRSSNSSTSSAQSGSSNGNDGGDGSGGGGGGKITASNSPPLVVALLATALLTLSMISVFGCRRPRVRRPRSGDGADGEGEGEGGGGGGQWVHGGAGGPVFVGADGVVRRARRHRWYEGAELEGASQRPRLWDVLVDDKGLAVDVNQQPLSWDEIMVSLFY